MNIIENTVQNYYDNQLLEHYGITIFSINEGLGDDLQKFKSGVIAAIKKLKSQIGDKAGYIISDVIKNAKSQGKKTLFVVLTMLCVFAGSASANISQQSADNFVQDMNKMYSKSENVGFKTNKEEKTAHYMDLMKNQNGDFFTGYGECLESGNFAVQKAEKNARLAAIQRFKETIGNENINDYEIATVYYCYHTDKSLSGGGTKCVAMLNIKKKDNVAGNNQNNQKLIGPSGSELTLLSQQEIQNIFNKNQDYCIGYAESNNMEDAVKQAIETAQLNYSEKTGHTFNGDKSKRICKPVQIQKSGSRQMVWSCTYIIKI